MRMREGGSGLKRPLKGCACDAVARSGAALARGEAALIKPLRQSLQAEDIAALGFGSISRRVMYGYPHLCKLEFG